MSSIIDGIAKTRQIPRLLRLGEGAGAAGEPTAAQCQTSRADCLQGLPRAQDPVLKRKACLRRLRATWLRVHLSELKPICRVSPRYCSWIDDSMGWRPGFPHMLISLTPGRPDASTSTVLDLLNQILVRLPAATPEIHVPNHNAVDFQVSTLPIHFACYRRYSAQRIIVLPATTGLESPNTFPT